MALMPCFHLILVTGHTLLCQKSCTHPRGASHWGEGVPAGWHLPLLLPAQRGVVLHGGVCPFAPLGLCIQAACSKPHLTASSSETPLFFTRSKSKRCEK